jgi:trk system potassium uptake protein TrkA
VKIIIVGAGEVGFHSAQKLSEENQDVVLIDKDPEKIKRITENLDVQAILGSGTSPGMLRNAGIMEANMLVAATDSDEVNLIACLLARSLNKYIVKVARVRNPEYLEEEGLFSQELLGVDQIINPEIEMVETIRNLMLIPGASDIIDFLDGRIKLVGITIKADSPFVNRPLLSFKELGGKVLMGAIVRGEEVFIPHGKDKLQINDIVYVVVRTDELSDLFQFLDIKDEALRRVIIVGGGATGTALAKVLDKTRLNVKLIEKNNMRCNELAEQLERVIVINGDGTDKELLQEENIREVDFMVVITGDEESNVLISLLAKGLGAKKTIARVNKSSYIPLVSSIGIDKVVTQRLAAVRAILQYIRRGKIISVAPLKGEHAEVIDAEALETSDIVHKPLSKLKFPKGALIGAITRGDKTFIPHGESIILPKDRLIIFALHKVIPKLEKMLTVKLDYF